MPISRRNFVQLLLTGALAFGFDTHTMRVGETTQPALHRLLRNRTVPPIYFSDYSLAGLLRIFSCTTHHTHRKRAMQLISEKLDTQGAILRGEIVYAFGNDQATPETIQENAPYPHIIRRNSVLYESLCEVLGPFAAHIHDHVDGVFSTDTIVKYIAAEKIHATGNLFRGTQTPLLATTSIHGGARPLALYLSTLVHEADHAARQKENNCTLVSEHSAYKKTHAALTYFTDCFSTPFPRELSHAQKRIDTIEYLSQDCFGSIFDMTYPQITMLAKHFVTKTLNRKALGIIAEADTGNPEKDAEVSCAARIACILHDEAYAPAIEKLTELFLTGSKRERRNVHSVFKRFIRPLPPAEPQYPDIPEGDILRSL